jgi:hypothetical protein
VSPVDPLTWAAAVAAGLAAAIYIFKRVQWLFRTLDTLSIVINHELSHNGGTSTKDRAEQAASSSVRVESQVVDLAVQVVDLASQVEDLSTLVNKHVTNPDAHGHA